MSEQTAPRLHGLPATEAPVVAVLRRGPSANPMISFEADLRALSPDPSPAPDEARRW